MVQKVGESEYGQEVSLCDMIFMLGGLSVALLFLSERIGKNGQHLYAGNKNRKPN